MSETDGERLARLGTDGEAWAKDFASSLKQINPTLDPIPGGWLMTWFANAIEAGRSAGYSQAKHEQDERAAQASVRPPEVHIPPVTIEIRIK